MNKMPKKKKNAWSEKYKLTLSKDETFEEVWQVRLTKFNFIVILGSSILLLVVLVAFLIAFTSLREFIPGYPDVNMRMNIVRNAILLDSLEHEIKVRDQYFENMKRIVSGQEPESMFAEQDTSIQVENIEFTRSLEDSLLRQQIESEEEYNLSVNLVPNQTDGHFYNLHFFPPLYGIISNRFNPANNHYGTDIVGTPDEVVHAALGGTVVFAGWTIETGNVIQIQHPDELITIYKHNSKLLKKVGMHVETGEAVALLGGSGELYTTGPHLHFEIWYKGEPLDPEKYIKFQ